MLHLFEVDDGEQWWYVAETEDEALRMHLEPIIGKLPDDLSQIAEDAMNYSINDIHITKFPPERNLVIHDVDHDDEAMDLPASEWVLSGKGFLASTFW